MSSSLSVPMWIPLRGMLDYVFLSVCSHVDSIEGHVGLSSSLSVPRWIPWRAYQAILKRGFVSMAESAPCCSADLEVQCFLSCYSPFLFSGDPVVHSHVSVWKPLQVKTISLQEEEFLEQVCTSASVNEAMLEFPCIIASYWKTLLNVFLLVSCF